MLTLSHGEGSVGWAGRCGGEMLPRGRCLFSPGLLDMRVKV